MEPRQTEEPGMSRRTWTVEEKLSMVLEMVKGQESITSLCHRHGVAMSQAYLYCSPLRHELH